MLRFLKEHVKKKLQLSLQRHIHTYENSVGQFSERMTYNNRIYNSMMMASLYLNIYGSFKLNKFIAINTQFGN